jgi:basic membrane lipoprotein Med (substrate-binding protein (PBP1-ABC) superfamily)
MDVNRPKAARLGTNHSAIPADVKAEVEALVAKMKSGELRP